jgi:hypothetical protein
MSRSAFRALYFVLACAFSLGTVSVAWASDETAPVRKPDVKVGDQWTYRVTVHRSNVPQVFTSRIYVSFVGPDSIVAVSTDAKGEERDSQYTSEWNAISLATGQVFAKPQEFFRFPMRVGDAHPFTFEAVAMRGSADRWRSEGGTKVMGWEDIVVPAGKFRALKLVIDNSFRGLSANFFGWAKREVWYVPEAKRWVKWVFSEGDHGKSWPNVKGELELLEYKVQ